MELPETVKVGAITYQVKQESRTADHSAYGMILYSESLISIQPGMSDDYKRVTLWHEMIHAMMHDAGLREHDETIVTALSHKIVQVLKENPGLAGI